MSFPRFACSSLMLSALIAALAMPAPQAQAQRSNQQLQPGPGQAPPRGGQAQQPPQGPRGQPAPPPQQQAQQPAPPKPYGTIAVTLPQPYSDASFEAFRKQLGDIAMKKDRAALAKLVVAKDFFWMGEKGDKANKRKSGIDNLAAAIELDKKDGSGWETLLAAANETTAEPIPDKKGVVCSPANPTFDEQAAEKMAKDTGTDPGDWGYPSKAGVEVHGAAQASSPVIETLGLHLVRVMPEDPPPGAQDMPFVKVVTPSGKVGFVGEEFLSSLDSDQMCYVKDAQGWKITGYAGND